MSVLDARAHICPECITAFAPVHPRQLFCCPAHRRAWHNREVARGGPLVSLDIVDRQTRSGTRGDRETGIRAGHGRRLLIARYADEDMAAGRMPAVEYLRRRFALGYQVS